MKARYPTFVAACLFAVLGGCAPPKDEPDRGNASSLVYSPAARLPSDRSAGGGAGEPTPASLADDPVRPPAGRACRVHLRREALGVAGQVPYALGTGNNITGERVQVSGTLERVGRDWLVLRAERSTYWIPRDVVLAVEFE